VPSPKTVFGPDDAAGPRVRAHRPGAVRRPRRRRASTCVRTARSSRQVGRAARSSCATRVTPGRIRCDDLAPAQRDRQRRRRRSSVHGRSLTAGSTAAPLRKVEPEFGDRPSAGHRRHPSGFGDYDKRLWVERRLERAMAHDYVSASGVGPANISIGVAPNSQRVPRSGQVTIAGTPVTVTQAGRHFEPTDFTGDGRAEVTVYRPSEGAWYANSGSSWQSTSGA